jgi:hypothetical protein
MGLNFNKGGSGGGLTEEEANDLYLRKIGDEFADQTTVDFSTFGGEHYGEGITERYYNHEDTNVYYSRTVGDANGQAEPSEVYQQADRWYAGVNNWSSYIGINDNGSSPYFDLYLMDNYSVYAYQYQDKEYWQVAHTNNYDEKLAYIITEITGTPYYESYGKEGDDSYYTYQSPDYLNIESYKQVDDLSGWSYLSQYTNALNGSFEIWGDNYDDDYIRIYNQYHTADWWYALQEKRTLNWQIEKQISLETRLNPNGYNYYYLASTDSGEANGNNYWDKAFDQYADRGGWGTYHYNDGVGGGEGKTGIDLWTDWGFKVYGGKDGSWINQFDLFAGEDNFWTAINDWEYYQLMRNNPQAFEKGYFVHAPDRYNFSLTSYVFVPESEPLPYYQEVMSVVSGWEPNQQPTAPTTDFGFITDRYPVIPSVLITSPGTSFVPDRFYSGKPALFLGTEDYGASRHGVHLGTTVLQDDKSLGNYNDTVRMGFSENRGTDNFIITAYSPGSFNDVYMSTFPDDYQAQTSLWIYGDGFNYQGYFGFDSFLEDYNGSGNEIYNEPGYSEHLVYADWNSFTPRYSHNIYANTALPYYYQGIYGGSENVYSGFYADASYNEIWLSTPYIPGYFGWGGIYSQRVNRGGQDLIELTLSGATLLWDGAVYGRTYVSHTAANNDNTLPHNAFYKITGDVTLYQKNTNDSQPVTLYTTRTSVTQTGNRSNAVTNNNLAGSIILTSAAGSTTATTLTVNNNQVAENDLIIINQKTGTNLYDLMITKVLTGSFNVTVRSTGGTATEAPELTFAVIKVFAK